VQDAVGIVEAGNEPGGFAFLSETRYISDMKRIFEELELDPWAVAAIAVGVFVLWFVGG